MQTDGLIGPLDQSWHFYSAYPLNYEVSHIAMIPIELREHVYRRRHENWINTQVHKQRTRRKKELGLLEIPPRNDDDDACKRVTYNNMMLKMVS